jgi:hypothetical protein
MENNALPKWGDLNTYERHKLVGEFIDGMIYSGEAVLHAQKLIETWRLMGYVRSIIMPQNEPQEVCPECDGKGCNECVIILNDEI